MAFSRIFDLELPWILKFQGSLDLIIWFDLNEKNVKKYIWLVIS